MNLPSADSELAERLRRTLVELISIPSVSFQEGPLADHVEQRLRARGCGTASAPKGGATTGATTGSALPRTRGEVQRRGDELLFRFPEAEGKPKVVFCGHLDTVPARDNLVARVEGDRVYGLGSSDLKAGLAVLLELIEHCDPATLSIDPRFVFYTCEEVAYHESGLPRLREGEDLLAGVRFAICVEPTSNAVELGCLGTLQAEATVRGKAAHSARPWLGENAIHAAAPLLQRIAALPMREVQLGETHRVTYREVVSATTIQGGSARNVVPDTVVVNFNFRFAPDRSLEDAQRWMREQIGDDAEVEFQDLSPSGRVAGDNPLCQRLIAAAGGVVRAKQAWTDVGRFSTWDIDAVSCGPGIPEQAHQKGEYATISGMVESARIFQDFLRNQP